LDALQQLAVSVAGVISHDLDECLFPGLELEELTGEWVLSATLAADNIFDDAVSVQIKFDVEVQNIIEEYFSYRIKDGKKKWFLNDPSNRNQVQKLAFMFLKAYEQLEAALQDCPPD